MVKFVNRVGAVPGLFRCINKTLSDDAGQFNILIHALCWVHAERIIHKLIGFTEEQRAAVDMTRNQIWTLYQKIKADKLLPTPDLSLEIKK